MAEYDFDIPATIKLRLSIKQLLCTWVEAHMVPHDIHREHLLEVLPLMEEIANRLGSPIAINNWLLTPVSPGGKKPIDYLAMRQYSIFRGFLLQVRTGQEIFRPLPSSSRVHQELSREEAEYTREQLRPRAWRDEDDVDIPASEEHPNENSR